MILTLDSLHKLPSLSPLVQRIVAGLAEDGPDAEVVSLIEQDPGLSVRLLRVANSAFYGLSGRIASVKDALLLLGYSSVRSIVLASCFSTAFKSSASSLDLNKYWRESLMTALYAEALAQSFTLRQSLAFTSGLLLDIGLIVLNVTDPDLLKKILTKVEVENVALEQAEIEVISTDHFALGAELLQYWRFPDEIADTLRRRGAVESDDPLTAVVGLAKLYVLHGGEGSSSLSGALIELCSRLAVDEANVLACLPEWEDLNEYTAELVKA